MLLQDITRASKYTPRRLYKHLPITESNVTPLEKELARKTHFRNPLLKLKYLGK